MPPPDTQEERNVRAMTRNRTRAEILHPQYESEDEYPGARRRAAATPAASELPEPVIEKRQYQNPRVIERIFKDWVAKHPQYDIPLNGIRIAGWIEENAQGFVCDQNIAAACRALVAKGRLLELKRKTPEMIAIEEDQRNLQPGQLGIDACDEELRAATAEQVREVLKRRRALAAQQSIGGTTKIR